MRSTCRLVLLAVLATGSLAGCVKEISSEERLDRETNNVPVKEAAGAAELRKITCAEPPEELVKARDVNRNETDRVMGYMEVYEQYKTRTTTFQEAMNRNPDLMYQEGSAEFVNARDLCIAQTAELRLEFEAYVRDLADMPTVQEIKGGNTVTVARLDLNTLKQAIESLSPDDKEMLLNKVTSAEKRLETAAEKPSRKR